MKTRPRHSLGELLRTQGEAFFARHGGPLSSHQKKTLRVLAKCRTASLGGHVQRCLDCGHQRMAYNSCRNRHCPQCQSVQQATWLQREAALLLPVEYHHVVFTVPTVLAELMATHPRMLYGLLLYSVQRTLLEVAANPKRLGARIGILAVLHTWGQTLQLHPHVHCVVTGGGLTADPATNLCNARLRFVWAGYEVAGFINNVFDSQPTLYLSSELGPTNLAYATTFRPRTIGE